MDALVKKVLDYLGKTEALELGASPWGTYEDDETVWPFDFDKFTNERREEVEPLKLPDEFVYDINRALKDEPPHFGDQKEFSGKAGKREESVSWDTCAWYQPLHFFGSDWGIFMREECLLKLAISIAKYTDAKAFNAEKSAAITNRVNGNTSPKLWGYSDAEIFLRAAVVCVYLHEHYHHRVECLGIRLQVVTQSSLYVPYSKGIYRLAIGTDDLLEEALANASMFLRLSEHAYKKMLPESTRVGLKKKLKASFPYDPPGYRLAPKYLDQSSFNSGENLLQGFMRETLKNPIQPSWHWESAPRLTQSFLNIRSNIYTVVPKGQRPILSPHAMPLSCSKDQLIRVCISQGFRVLANRGAGSHTVMAKNGVRGIVTIPHRKDLSIGVIKNTLATIGGYKVHDLPVLLNG
jgi:hypothetical protein